MPCGAWLQDREDFVECADVILPIVRRKRDSGEQHLYMGIVQSRQNRIQVFPGLLQRKATQAVVATEFHDHDSRVGLNNRTDIDDRVLRRRSAGTHIRYFVGIAALIEIPLESIGKSLPGDQTVTSRYAVAIANDLRPASCNEQGSSNQQTTRNENPAPYVHINSVMSQKGNRRLSAAVYVQEGNPG